MTGGGVSRIVFRHWLWATLSRDAKFGPLACSPGSRKPILPAQLDVTLGRFDIGRTRAATRRPMSPPRSTASSVFDTDTGSPIALIELLFAAERQIPDVIFVKA